MMNHNRLLPIVSSRLIRASRHGLKNIRLTSRLIQGQNRTLASFGLFHVPTHIPYAPQISYRKQSISIRDFSSSNNLHSTPSASIIHKDNDEEDNNDENSEEGEEGEEEEEEAHTEPPSTKYTVRPWEDYYQALVRHQKIHGSCDVRDGTKTDPSLVYFCRKTRRNPDALTTQQRELLDSIGFDWRMRADRWERQWEEKYSRLIAFQKDYGHCKVPTRYSIDISLGRWVDRNRRLQHEGRLPKDRLDKLNAIGFVWTKAPAPPKSTDKNDKKWNRQFAKLSAFSREHGHCFVPTRNEEDPKLGNWTSQQRSLNRQGLLREDRKMELEQIGFVFEIDPMNARAGLNQQQWEEKFESLLQYKEKHGNCDVPQAYQENGLGTWVHTQRKREREGRMEPVRRDRLLDAGFQFSQNRDELWQSQYQKLKTFANKFGDCLVPREHDQTLATWVSWQRLTFHERKLTKERQAKLEALGFVWRLRNSPSRTKSSEE